MAEVPIDNEGEARPREDRTMLVDVPKELGPYQLSRLLGRGGMGEVWLGFDTRLERDVAVKLMRRELLANEEAVKRFYREARSVARLNHPNIVQVYSIGEERGVIYFVMEYVEGETVTEKLKREGPLALEDAVNILLQTVEGLSYANARGIIHRDIKPSNLMLTRDFRVKIADFGLAKMIEHDTQVTATGTAMGSPNYMSPEQSRGEEADHRSDIYALGISLYQVLTGTLPFSAPTALSVLLKQIQEPLPEPDELKGLADGRVLDTIKKMAAKSPEDRYQTYGGLAAAVSELAPGIAVNPSTHTATATMEPATPVPAGGTAPAVGDLAAAAPAGVETGFWAQGSSRRNAVFALGAGAVVITALAVMGVVLLRGTGGSGKSPGQIEEPAVAVKAPNVPPGPAATPANAPSPTVSPSPAPAEAASPAPQPSPPAAAGPLPEIAFTPAPSAGPSATPVAGPGVPGAGPAQTPPMMVRPAMPAIPIPVTPVPATKTENIVLGATGATAGAPVSVFDGAGRELATLPAGTHAKFLRLDQTAQGPRYVIEHQGREALVRYSDAKPDYDGGSAARAETNPQPESFRLTLGTAQAKLGEQITVYQDPNLKRELTRLPGGTVLDAMNEPPVGYRVFLPDKRTGYVVKKDARRAD